MLELRKVTDSEIHLNRELAREIWYEHYTKIISLEQIDYMLELFYSPERIQLEIEEGVIWEMLWEDDEAIGYLVCELYPKVVFLSKIYLKANQRGKGYGKLMINRVLELAKTHEKEAIRLNVNKHNSETIAFYESCGFKRKSEGVFDIGNGFVMDDYIYELRGEKLNQL